MYLKSRLRTWEHRWCLSLVYPFTMMISGSIHLFCKWQHFTIPYGWIRLHGVAIFYPLICGQASRLILDAGCSEQCSNISVCASIPVAVRFLGYIPMGGLNHMVILQFWSGSAIPISKRVYYFTFPPAVGTGHLHSLSFGGGGLLIVIPTRVRWNHHILWLLSPWKPRVFGHCFIAVGHWCFFWELCLSVYLLKGQFVWYLTFLCSKMCGFFSSQRSSL